MARDYRRVASGQLVGTDILLFGSKRHPGIRKLVERAEEPGAYWERLDVYEEEALEVLE